MCFHSLVTLPFHTLFYSSFLPLPSLSFQVSND
jgi:hypothetical protein